MINFDQFRNFDRIQPLSQEEQQRLYWIYRNDALNFISRSGGGGAGSGGGGRRVVETGPASFSFFTVPGQQFITIPNDILVKTSTGYVKAFYPYDVSLGPFGTGDPNTNISVDFVLPNFWVGDLPFKILSCDVDGNPTGDLVYVKFDNLSGVMSIDFTKTKDTIEIIDVSGCIDLEEFTITSSVSLETLNISNTSIQTLDLNGCEYLKFLDITSTQFSTSYTLDVSGVSTLVSLIGDNCNLFGLITSSSVLEEVSLNDCPSVSSVICNNFTGNFGLGRIQIKNCSLGPNALDQLYTSLSTPNGTNNTIYVYGNSGIISSNPSIATDKGYTIDINP
jgi:hypothetical protein